MPLEVVATEKFVVHDENQKNAISLVFGHTASRDAELLLGVKWDDVVDIVGIQIIEIDHSYAFCATESDDSFILSNEMRVSQVSSAKRAFFLAA